MKKRILHFTTIAIMLLFAACSNEGLFNENDKDLSPETNANKGRTITMTASMPDGADDNNLNTRMGLDLKTDKSIDLLWEKGDQIQVAAIQGNTRFKDIVTVHDISADGKQAQFDIKIPEEFGDKTFSILGLHGGTGLGGPTNYLFHAEMPKNTYKASSLASVKERKDVMIYFPFQGLPADYKKSVQFQHFGSLFTISLKNTGNIDLNNIVEARLVGPDGGKWAINSGAGGSIYDLYYKRWENPATSNYIAFSSEKSTLKGGETITFWGWYPGSPNNQFIWPELKLELKDGDGKTFATSVNSKPARTGLTENGKVYYFFSIWNGSNLGFTDESFTPLPPIEIDKNSIAYEGIGGDQIINIAANVNWTASSSESWLTIAPASGSNNGSITLTATPNGPNARTAIITITDGTTTKTVPVTQKLFIPATDIFISEYAHGGHNNNYIEIYNGTGATVDLSDYKVCIYKDGSETVTEEQLFVGRNLEHGKVIVIHNIDPEQPNPVLYTGEVTLSLVPLHMLNGDDAITLEKISTGKYLDIIGKVGERPIIAGVHGWTANAAQNLMTNARTIVRKPSVHGGVTVNPAEGFPTLATEWIGFPVRTVYNLGSHTTD